MRDRITSLETKILIRDSEIKKLKEGGGSEKTNHLEVMTENFGTGKFTVDDIIWGVIKITKPNFIRIEALIDIHKLENIPF